MSDILNLKELVFFANKLADKSEQIIMQFFRNRFDVLTKDDNTPVTIADKKSEELIRALIKNTYPTHGIIGEEYEDINFNSEYTWVIDPIDGTRSFIAGHKDFGTLIALLQNNKPILGIINCPAHKERWVGIDNEPTTLNETIISTSNKHEVKNSIIFSSGLYFDDIKFKQSFDKIIKKTRYYRFGGDCYMYGMLAAGLIDIVIEDTLKTWDYMALIPIIKGAGGIITDKNNNPITLDSDGSLVASANSKLHKEVFETINSNKLFNKKNRL